jgi:4-diphosphocytidyl-2-C-methyl-D-erythritol kinase
VSRAKAFAKVNLALVVGPLRADGKHEVVTVLQQVDLHDDVELDAADGLAVHGFEKDTLVRSALEGLAASAGVAPGWSVRIEKRIPVAAGLGGGSSDAAAALSLANALLACPLSPEQLRGVAARVGADVPFFLRDGPQLGSGDGSDLSPLDLPLDYVVLFALVGGATKESTAAVYRVFDERSGAERFDVRREALTSALARVERARDLAALPRNDLVSSPLSAELEGLGAFRADVSGAGPVVYALFERPDEAERAAAELGHRARTWLVRPLADA